MDRRRFLGIAGLGTLHELGLRGFAANLEDGSSSPITGSETEQPKAYGSGHFGEWITDRFGLPAYRYTCNQITDTKAVSPVHKDFRAPTDHTHQVGNDRLVAAVSNYGYVQVRQDEGSPKFLNDYSPEHGLFGAGVGFLTDGNAVLSTYYSGKAESFDRTFGIGYFNKIVKGHMYEVEQTILAPFGDDPVLISMVTITNHGDSVANLRWIEYWGVHNYQFSYRSFMQAALLGDVSKAAAMRRAFAGRFSHRFQLMPNHAGLVETQIFQGRPQEDVEMRKRVEESKDNLSGGSASQLSGFVPGASMEDITPPPTFLVSLDTVADGYATDAASFFGHGGVERPSGLAARLTNELGTTGEASAFLLERALELQPRQSRTLCYLCGYAPEGFEIDELVKKYSADPAGVLARSSAAWKTNGIRFSVPAEPWADREIRWHGYYLRSSLTYDSFFREHIISQGNIYQYVWGFQGAVRDPLQHTMPFIFTHPEIVRQIVRYTLKQVQPDGSIPYAIVGCGVPMPAKFMPSDQEMWLLWTTAEYVLSSRDRSFLDERIPVYGRQESGPTDPTIRELLNRSFLHLTNVIGVGKHGLMRMLTGDFNDTVVDGRVPKDLLDEAYVRGESVLNAAMATYVLDYYARMLAYIGDAGSAGEARAKAEAQRKALRENWSGQWFRRAWLGPHSGWIGEKRLWLEPQPWAIIGGAASAEQRRTLIATLNELVRRPSPIGAVMMNEGEPILGKEAGVPDDGGISPSVNGTLIWALAVAGGPSAWDEWKKNSLAMHAESYPDTWYGIWSGPDTYNSVRSKYPGQTMFVPRLPDGRKGPGDWGLFWTDFPVMNMHIHAWPLYTAAKLLGVEFQQNGVRFNPALPVEEYEFASPLLGFKKSSKGYTGWYAPLVSGQWEVELLLPASEMARLKQITVNGLVRPFVRTATSIRIAGASSPGMAFRREAT
jgi:hypothetical protein